MIVAVVIIVYAVTGFKFGYYTGQVSAPVNIPVANISVTDGRNVVKTGEKGCFELKGYKKTHFITITVPAGYTTENYYIPVEKDKYDGYDFVLEMLNRQNDMKIPTELVPVCPHCGKPLTMNLRSDDKFVEDEGWHKANERYQNFLHKNENQKIVFLELGVGYNTPVIIKYPFWQMTAKNPNTTYACINQGQAVCPPEIQHKSICINDDISNIINECI